MFAMWLVGAVSLVFGRVYCAYACPQTVWLEFCFRPIEAFLEGGPVNQKALNLAPWTGRKREMALSPSKSMLSGSASGSEKVDQVWPIRKPAYSP